MESFDFSLFDRPIRAFFGSTRLFYYSVSIEKEGFQRYRLHTCDNRVRNKSAKQSCGLRDKHHLGQHLIASSNDGKLEILSSFPKLISPWKEVGPLTDRGLKDKRVHMLQDFSKVLS